MIMPIFKKVPLQYKIPLKYVTENLKKRVSIATTNKIRAEWNDTAWKREQYATRSKETPGAGLHRINRLGTYIYHPK